MDVVVDINVFIFIPAVICGLCGGALGGVFSYANIKMNRWRNANIKPKNWLRVLDVMAISFVVRSHCRFSAYCHCRTHKAVMRFFLCALAPAE